jgi:hypothetical protein
MAKIAPIAINSLSLSYASVPFALNNKGDALEIIKETAGALHTISYPAAFSSINGEKIEIQGKETYSKILIGTGVIHITTLSELPVNITLGENISLQEFRGSVSLFYEVKEGILELKIENPRSYSNSVYIINLLISE